MAAIKKKNYTIGEDHEKIALKKAKTFLRTLEPRFQNSVSAAIRHCIEIAPSSPSKI